MKKNSLRKFIVLAMVALMIVTVLSGCTPPRRPEHGKHGFRLCQRQRSRHRF